MHVEHLRTPCHLHALESSRLARTPSSVASQGRLRRFSDYAPFLVFPRLIATYFQNWGKLRLLAGVGTALGRLEAPWDVFWRVLTAVRVLPAYMKTTAPATFCKGDVRSLTAHDLQPIALAKCQSCEMKLQFPECLLFTGNSNFLIA